MKLTSKNLQNEINRLRILQKKDKNKDRALGIDRVLFELQVKFKLFEFDEL